jgi:hypothetical protein
VAGTPVTDNGYDTTSALDVRIGRLSLPGGLRREAEMFAVVIWREALSAADVVLAIDELNGIFVSTGGGDGEDANDGLAWQPIIQHHLFDYPPHILKMIRQHPGMAVAIIQKWQRGKLPAPKEPNKNTL